MLSDYTLATLCQAQYDGATIFDSAIQRGGDCVALKNYPDCSVVIHEGSHDFLNWYNNFRAGLVEVPDFGGVEEGFYINLPEMCADLLPLIPKNKPVYLTGHSRGAARAVIMAAMLVKQGYTVICVVFGCPKPGDAVLASILEDYECRWYRNTHDFEEQDFVCDVPIFCPITFKKFSHAGECVMIDVAPPENDSWGALAWHHLELYQKGAKNG